MQLYCERLQRTLSILGADIRAPRRHAGELCTRASKCMRTVRSGMSEVARRSANGMQLGYLSGERQKLVTGPYREGDIRLLPINLPLRLPSPLYRLYTSCLRYKNYALLQQNLWSLKPVNVVACKPGQHPGPRSTFARDTKRQVQSWSATRPTQRPKNRL